MRTREIQSSKEGLCLVEEVETHKGVMNMTLGRWRALPSACRRGKKKLNSTKQRPKLGGEKKRRKRKTKH